MPQSTQPGWRNAALLASLAVAALLALVTTWTAALARVPQQRAAVERLLRAQTGLDVQLRAAGRAARLLRSRGGVQRRRDAPTRRGRAAAARAADGGALRELAAAARRAAAARAGAGQRRGDRPAAARDAATRGGAAGDAGATAGAARAAPAARRGRRDAARPARVAPARAARRHPRGQPRLRGRDPGLDRSGARSRSRCSCVRRACMRAGAPTARSSPAPLLLPARLGRTLFVTAQLRNGARGDGFDGRLRISGRGLVLASWREFGWLPAAVTGGSGDVGLSVQLRGGRVQQAEGHARLVGLGLSTPQPVVARRFGLAAGQFTFSRTADGAALSPAAARAAAGRRRGARARRARFGRGDGGPARSAPARCARGACRSRPRRWP